ncbi:hypothetical protein PROFUN_07138 [Planoprotostelium fungivorum]|uniref:Uncharacterized protein n=1 Tax=Planoprotostelium fungivorum TaxID=1890364 RepID=A0A2P6NMK3_9EUKA|nr:hypothetical protein PROFUN_07138 [Planoprotostelium fungivorum]
MEIGNTTAVWLETHKRKKSSSGNLRKQLQMMDDFLDIGCILRKEMEHCDSSKPEPQHREQLLDWSRGRVISLYVFHASYRSSPRLELHLQAWNVSQTVFSQTRGPAWFLKEGENNRRFDVIVLFLMNGRRAQLCHRARMSWVYFVQERKHGQEKRTMMVQNVPVDLAEERACQLSADSILFHLTPSYALHDLCILSDSLRKAYRCRFAFNSRFVRTNGDRLPCPDYRPQKGRLSMGATAADPPSESQDSTYLPPSISFLCRPGWHIPRKAIQHSERLFRPFSHHYRISHNEELTHPDTGTSYFVLETTPPRMFFRMEDLIGHCSTFACLMTDDGDSLGWERLTQPLKVKTQDRSN